MSHTFVTGGTGFIGWHLAAALRRRGDQVRSLVRPTSRVDRLEPLGVTFVPGDVRDRASLKTAIAGADVVYHLAGLTRARTPDQLFAVNRDGVNNVAQACAAQASVPTLVVVSSLAAAGPSPPDRPRTEQDPTTPVSNYGRSKLAGEQAARNWAARVPTTIIRPPIVLGEGDKDGLLLFRIIARRGIHIVPAMGAARVAVLHADDLAVALLLAAERGERIASAPSNARTAGTQGIYFVADTDQPTYADLGRAVGQAVGRTRIRVVHAPRPTVRLAALGGELVNRVLRKPTLMNEDKFRDATAGSWTCNDTRFRAAVGFAPAQPLASRLRQTADWYRRAGWL